MPPKIHGHSHGNGPGIGQSRTYRIWSGMKSRCTNPRMRIYKYYGGKGVKVCDRWQSFTNFLTDMGECPSPSHTIDRIDGNGDYEPGNCRWITLQKQQRNRSNNRRVTAFGRTQTLIEWAEEKGFDPKTLQTRFQRNWDAERALSTPLTFRGNPQT